ncbi:MAG TPA: AlpA family transcriptional regulator [Rickettsiales bacterium]|nr:AlpA family transcriptional regulator [Rickettsiales bacterium]
MHTSTYNTSRILRLPEVIKRTGWKRSSIYAHEKAGQFPKRVKLGLRSVGWLESEIDAWIENRIKTSRGNQ